MAAHPSALRAADLVFPARCLGGIIEAVHGAMLNPTAKNPLDSAHHGFIVRRHEGESIAIAGSAARSADTVNVGIGGVGHVVVDHVGNAGHVDSPCGDVGRHQDLIGAVSKAVQRRLASLLGQIALQGGRLVARSAQLFSQTFGAVFGAGEYQHRLGVRTMQKLKEHSCFEVLFHRVERVADGVRRGCGADLDRDRSDQHVAGQAPDFSGHGGREHQGLPLWGKMAQDPSDVGEKAHVEHVVRLVEDQHVHAGKGR